MSVLNHIEGDLLTFPFGITTIVHGCNCQKAMGSGIARSIREKWPEVYQADCNFTLTGSTRLGLYSWATVDGGGVINLYTQNRFGYGRHLNYEALYSGLERIRFNLRDSNAHLGFPEIGCGLGGGDLAVVETMINSVFKNSPIKTTMVHYVQPV